MQEARVVPTPDRQTRGAGVWREISCGLGVNRNLPSVSRDPVCGIYLDMRGQTHSGFLVHSRQDLRVSALASSEKICMARRFPLARTHYREAAHLANHLISISFGLPHPDIVEMPRWLAALETKVLRYSEAISL